MFVCFRLRFVARSVALMVALGVFPIVSGACSRKPPEASPDGAVRELVERLRMVNGDPAASKAAFEMLSTRARENLAERAQRYSAASGKTIAPEAMLVPARFSLRFEPQRYSAQIAGKYALVEIQGLAPEDRASVPCVLEEAGWRVDLALPPLPPVQVRPGSSP